MQDSNEISFFEIFPWTDNFNTGIELIDEQHKQLVDILNRLAAHLANLSDDIILNEIFDELAQYADYHFKTEEKIWSANFKNDVWFTEHEHTHDSFIDQVIELKNNTKNVPLENIITDIVSFLSKWLAYHILDTDKRMAKAVLAMQTGKSLEESKLIASNEMEGSMQVLIHTVLDMYDNLSHRSLELMKEKTLRKRAEEALNESEERWKFILEGGSEDIWDWDMLKNEVLISKDNTFGLEILTNNNFTNILETDKKRVETDLKNHLDGKTDFFTSKYRVITEDGKYSWILNRGKVISRNEDGVPLRMIGTHSNITERELASLIYKNSSQAMLITDVDNHIISTNPAFTNITGYEEEDVLGKDPSFMSSKKNDLALYKRMWTSITEKGSWSGELYNKRKNGEIYVEFLNINAIVNNTGEIDHYVGLFSDISEKKKSDEIIREQASIDSLTKLYNRRMFQTILNEEIENSQRYENKFALLFIDLDNFKDVNDNLGHAFGDLLLIEAAQRIQKCIRKTDILARLGGDEFSIIFPNLTDSYIVDKLTSSIIENMCKPFKLDDKTIYLSASVGISLYPNDAQDASSLLKSSDQAMYLAKKSGRNCYRYFTTSMQEEAEARHELILDLYRAIENNQFELYYQPILELDTDKVTKAEALIRWNHPSKGLIYPDSFIPLAEESGLIITIGDWVCKEAAIQTKIWNSWHDTDIQVSVNISPIQFKVKDLISTWNTFLQEHEVEKKHISVEITENVLMDNEETIHNQLIELRDLGIQISLDDFGTGYSSLSYLRKFNVDYLKIDRSFIMNLEVDTQDFTLCEAIVSMAHKLNIKVIAEGIETESQKKILTDMHCDYGQGYLMSKPIPAKEFEKLLES